MGDYSVRWWVHDSGGESVSGTIAMVVDPQLRAEMSISTSDLALGHAAEINATVSGGGLPYSYVYAGLPPGCVSVDGPSIGCLPTQAGLYNLTVNVTDHNGVLTNASDSRRVLFDFTVAAPSQAKVDHSFTLTVQPVGGYGTLGSSYRGLPPGCVSVAAPEVVCPPTQLGQYTISLSVDDQAGDHATHQISLKVVGGRAPPIPLIFVSPLVLGGVVGTAVALVLVALVLYPRRGRHRRSGFDLYAAYRLSAGNGLLTGPNPDVAQHPTAENPASSRDADEDPLSDLV